MPGDREKALLCVLSVVLVVTVVFGSIFLHYAVSLCNRMVGGDAAPRRIPRPTLWKAIAILVVTFFVSSLLCALIMNLITLQSPRPFVVENAILISLPFGLLFMAFMVRATLPTTFARALLVVLLFVALIVFVFGGTLGVAVLLAVMMFRSG
jgi:hypothetical protein